MMPANYENPIIDPPLSDWPSFRATLAGSALQSLRTMARRRLVQSAEQFVQRLRDIGQGSGLLREPPSLLSGDSDSTPIVMTGHQPVIFHSGLTFKYATTESFAADTGAIAVAVIIDTDEGDAGAFTFPEAASDSGAGSTQRMETAEATLGMAPSLYMASLKKPSARIETEAQRVITGLESCGCSMASTYFRKVADQYASLATESMMEANLIVRWNAGIGGRILELPLSAICGFPEVIRFFGEILSRPFEFAECYNETLSAFRTDQKIRNAANPFPNLQTSAEQCELPFWIVDRNAGIRSAVSIQTHGQDRTLVTTAGAVSELIPGNEAATIFSLMIAGKHLIPRGALITASLRLLFSDLFVHGTGGGRYDRYTDTLIRRWWNVEPSPFAVASASRYLFAEQRQELSRIQGIAGQLRDLQFNPQRHFGTGIFSPALEESLRQKIARKDAAVERLRMARDSGESARDIGREIQQIGDEIKTSVAAEFEGQLSILKVTSDQSIATLNNRLWPWMFFEA